MKRCRNSLHGLWVILLGGLTQPALRAVEISKELPVQINLGILSLEFNHNTVLMCLVVAALICLGAWLCVRNLKEIPGKGQAVFEMIFGAFEGLVIQSLGQKRAASYLPWIGSLFLFMWLSNMIGLFPIPAVFLGQELFHDYNHNGVFDPGEFDPAADTNGNGIHDNGVLVVPRFAEPTSDYSVPLGMALFFVLFIGHGSSIRKNGILGYLKGYFDPGGVMGVVMFPLNVVGKIAELVSISFRIFGNIFGGTVILVVVGWLLHYMPVMVGPLAYFGIFSGTVQAFVFTMLAMTYISLGVADEQG